MPFVFRGKFIIERATIEPSVITSKPATHDHFKTGQRTEPRT